MPMAVCAGAAVKGCDGAAEEEKMDVSNEGTNKDIIIRSLKQPTCISAKEDGNTINLEVEKELGIETHHPDDVYDHLLDKFIEKFY